METMEDTFTEFFERTEPKLRNALVASYGVEVGTEAASDALAFGWEHWDRVQGMENPIGYLFRVGRSRSRRFRRRPPLPMVAGSNPGPWGGAGTPEGAGAPVGASARSHHPRAFSWMDLCRDR